MVIVSSSLVLLRLQPAFAVADAACLPSQNILTVYGVVRCDDGRVMMVMQLGDMGSLSDVLKRSAKHVTRRRAAAEGGRGSSGDGGDDHLSWRLRITIAAGIAAGMEFLHAQVPRIVHRACCAATPGSTGMLRLLIDIARCRSPAAFDSPPAKKPPRPCSSFQTDTGDLKCGNVVLSRGFVPHVADFGISNKVDSLVRPAVGRKESRSSAAVGDLQPPIGTLRYLAPELLLGGMTPPPSQGGEASEVDHSKVDTVREE